MVYFSLTRWHNLCDRSINVNHIKCTESKAEEKSVLEQYGLVNDLIEEIKALTLDYPDRKPQLINAIEQLNAMKAKRLGKLK